MDEEQDNFYDDEDSYEEPEPTFLKVILRETDDVVLFECASTTIPAESEDAAAVLENNAKYEYLTVGKGRHRPTLDAEVQNPLNIAWTERHKFFPIIFRLKPLWC